MVSSIDELESYVILLTVVGFKTLQMCLNSRQVDLHLSKIV